MPRPFDECRAKVFNRGRPPVSFLEELVDWGISAQDEIFVPNNIHDVYSQVRGELGPWVDLKHRKAVMLEVLRVLAGFESSWDWNAGVDTTNPDSDTPCTEEAGLLQSSGSSMAFDPSLKALLVAVSGKSDCDTFRAVTKSNHEFALEYTARLLRFTVDHHGPLRDKKINPWLRPAAVAEFMSFMPP